MRSVAFVLLLAPAAVGQVPDSWGDPLEAMRAELRAARDELTSLREWSPPLRGSLGVDVTTQYLFRGIPQEHRGVIVQPSVELVFGLNSATEELPATGLVLGTWNSLHDGPTGAPPSAWYESDAYAGLSMAAADWLQLGVRYTAYASPNDRFGTVQEVAVSAVFADAGLGLPVALRPSLLVAFEVAGQADAASELGTYAELGFDPDLLLGEIDECAVSLLLPVRVGCSLGDYYEQPAGGRDAAFGCLDVGIGLALSLPFVPAVRDGWLLELCLHWTTLGRSNEERNGGDGSELIGIVGISTTF
ncbi:MAG: TorF family putative porin [Planctomycetota bacterium]